MKAGLLVARQWPAILAAGIGLSASLAARAQAAASAAFGPGFEEESEPLVFNAAALTGSCGVERWSVKTGTDPDAGQVNLAAPSANTIAVMTGWPAPAPIPPNNRVAPYETTAWVLTATLTKYKLESDSDIHLILDDGSGRTLIAEIPDPACVGTGSPFAAAIANARAQFTARYTPTGSFQAANIPVQVTGAGMFDFLHGQTGVAPNGIELHPVVDLVFNPATGGDFSLFAAPSALTVARGGAAASTLSVTVGSGFNAAVAFSAPPPPAGVSAAFNPATLPAPGGGNSRLTIAATTAAACGVFPLTVTAAGGGRSHAATVNVSVVDGSPVAPIGNTLRLARATACAGAGHPVLSQLQTAGAGGASDEFIELYNPLNAPYDLSGHALKYHSAANNPGSAGINFPAGTQIPAHGYLLVAPATYTGSVAPDVGGMTAGLAAAAGHVYLVQGTATLTSACPPVGDVIIDRIGYGAGAVCAEGNAPAAAPGGGQSVKRLPNNAGGSGQDTDNNAADFTAASASAPRNRATVVSCGAVQLSWGAAAGDAYRVYRDSSPDLSTRQLIASPPSSNPSASDAMAGSQFYAVLNYTACGGESAN